MSRTTTITDHDILIACREVAASGLDPSYKTLRDHGLNTCGYRIRTIRDSAVLSGELTLPSASRITPAAHVPYVRLRPIARKPRSEIRIPKTLHEFLAIERSIAAWAKDAESRLPLVQRTTYFASPGTTSRKIRSLQKFVRIPNWTTVSAYRAKRRDRHDQLLAL